MDGSKILTTLRNPTMPNILVFVTATNCCTMPSSHWALYSCSCIKSIGLCLVHFWGVIELIQLCRANVPVCLVLKGAKWRVLPQIKSDGCLNISIDWLALFSDMGWTSRNSDLLRCEVVLFPSRRVVSDHWSPNKLVQLGGSPLVCGQSGDNSHW